MKIRHGFLIKDSWTGVTGRVIEVTTDASGDYTVRTRRDIQKVQGFNAEILSYIDAQIGDVVNVTNGTQNFTGVILSQIDTDEYEMALTGIAGTVAVHTSQMYQIVSRAQALAAAS